MQAVFFEQHGGPEVLKFGEFKDPVVGPNEALINVKACALNHLDIWVRQGLPGVSIPMPHIPGSDVSGIVLDFGKGVKRNKKIFPRSEFFSTRIGYVLRKKAE